MTRKAIGPLAEDPWWLLVRLSKYSTLSEVDYYVWLQDYGKTCIMRAYYHTVFSTIFELLERVYRHDDGLAVEVKMAAE